MKEQFVTYEIALKLKELGFNDECLATINQIDSIHINKTKRLPSGNMTYDEIPAPLYQQAYQFLLYLLRNTDMELCFGDSGNHIFISFPDGENSTTCESHDDCIEKLIEIINKCNK